GPAYFVAIKPRDASKESWIGAVVFHTLLEKVDALHDPVEPITVIIEFDRDVVGKIVALKVPHGPKMGLQTDNLLQNRLQTGPVFLHLILVSAVPQQLDRDSTQSKCGQFRGVAGWIDFA